MTSPTPVRILVAVVATLLLLAWWVVERRANGSPRTDFFAGSVSLLQDVRDPNELSLEREIGVILSASTDHPEQLQIAVVVCGGLGLPFRGQLVLSGDARLDSPFWFNPAILDGAQEEAKPAYDDGASLQIFSFEIDVVHTICPGEDIEDAAIFGQAVTITGASQQPHTRSFKYWGIGTARGTVALPSLGHIPADSAMIPDYVPQASVPVFGGPFNNLDPSAEIPDPDSLGLIGLIEPFGVRYQSLVETSLNQRPEVLTQSEEASSGLTSVRWRSTEPIVAYARLIDDDAHASHQSQLVMMTMIFGIATSILAAAVWSSFDRSAGRGNTVTASRANTGPSQGLGTLAVVAAFLLLILASSRKKGSS